MKLHVAAWVVAQILPVSVTAGLLRFLTRGFLLRTTRGLVPQWLFGLVFLLCALAIELILKSHLGFGFLDWLVSGCLVGILFFVMNALTPMKLPK